MLTKEHLKYRRRGERVYPGVIEPEAAAFVGLAGELLALYRSGVEEGVTRGELGELVEALVRGCADAALARAFNKLILDHCEFAAAAELDYPAARTALFGRGGALLGEGLELAAYRAALAAEPEYGALLGAGDIYGDLPDNERLLKMREMTAKELTHRYNVAQVQGLLMAANELVVTVSDPEPAELRRLAKYLKFFRLLGSFRAGKTESELIVTVSGPFAIFQNTRKYAVQLASFFPAVLLMKKWSLAAKLSLGGRELELKLDESSRLKSHYRNFSAYVPEEIAMFHRHFREKAPAWRIVPGTVLRGEGAERIFSDFTFGGPGGETVHLELFHRWHRTELERRLALLRQRPELPLLLGIDRALCDDAEYAALAVRDPALAARLFRFRDFPGVDRVGKLLEQFRMA